MGEQKTISDFIQEQRLIAEKLGTTTEKIIGTLERDILNHPVSAATEVMILAFVTFMLEAGFSKPIVLKQLINSLTAIDTRKFPANTSERIFPKRAPSRKKNTE